MLRDPTRISEPRRSSARSISATAGGQTEVRVQQTPHLSQIRAVPPPSLSPHLSGFDFDDQRSPEMKVLHISHLAAVYHG